MITDSSHLDTMDNDGTNNNVKLLGIQRTPDINTTPSLASFDELPPTPPPIATSNNGSKSSLPHPNSSPDNSSSEEDVEAPRSPSQRSNRSKQERSKKKCGAARVVSGLYARLLIVAAAILVLTEVLNNPVPLLYYNGYLFSYIIGGAIVCILTTYICVLAKKCPTLNDDLEGADKEKQTGILLKDTSVYLRIGILVLGLGMLTWIGMEIGTYFTVERFCMDELNLAQPVLLGLFTLLQILFVFMNTPRVLKSLGWFRNIGLMHLQAANLAVWIRLFLWETAKQWLEETHITHNSTIPRPQDDFNATLHVVDTDKNHKVYFGTRCSWSVQEEEKIEQVLLIKHCLQESSIGAVWEKAMPFVFPFVLQFSLVCSAVMYHLWQSSTLTVVHCNVNSTPRSRSPMSDVVSKQKCGGPKVDCRGSSKGLFLGLLVTVVGLIVLILFFVLTNNEKLHLDTVFIISSVHCGVMGLSVLAILIGLCKIKRMCSASQPQPDLHSAIESWGTVCVFIFGACGMIVGSRELHNTKYLVVFVDGAAMLFHCCIQALFIQLLMKKCCRPGCEHEKSKPGRQTVTFLIFTNFVLWLMESITAQNPVAGKLQLNFYGVIPWGLIARGILSIVMCYRFLCSAALMDAWRNCYSSSR